MRTPRERGFTLIELLIIIAIVGILAKLGLTSFQTYRGSAARGVMLSTWKSMELQIESRINDTDNPPSTVTAGTHRGQGIINDDGGLPFISNVLPAAVNAIVDFDPTCRHALCENQHVELSHCTAGFDHLQVVKFGDGLTIETKLPGRGTC